MPIKLISIPPPTEAELKYAGRHIAGPELYLEEQAWRWRDIMEKEGYMAAYNKAVKLIPETADILPILVDIKEGRTNAEKTRISRAQKAVAKALADFMHQWRRFRPESKHKSFDILKDYLLRSRPLWRDYEAEKFRPKEKPEKKSNKRKYPVVEYED